MHPKSSRSREQYQSLSQTKKEPSVADLLQPLRLSHDTDQITYTSSLLTQEELELLESMLKCNKDIFAWTHSDMPRIHPFVASHKLNILPTSRPIQQKVRHFHPDRQKIIQAEIDKLLVVEFIKEVKYPDWLANVVVVPKKNGKWRVCIDYTNLNDGCPNDSFPLPRID